MTDDTPTPTPDRRRGSFSSTTFSAIFGPRGSTNGNSNGNGNGTPPSAPRQNPSPPSSTISPSSNPPPSSTTAPLPTPSRRRMSISTLGLSGSPLSTTTGPPFFPHDRRASIASSTASSLPNSAVSESAIEDDSPDTGSVPTTPFSRHMSFGGSSSLFPRGGVGGGGSNGVAGPTSPQSKSRSPSDAGGLNWSEQFRERAASTVQRPMMGSSPPAAAGFGSIGGGGAGGAGGGGGGGGSGGSVGGGAGGGPHVRARSEGGDHTLSPATATATATARRQPVPHRKERRKPDEVGERMLRGEFYMD